jgi:hypothetical protein
MMRFGYAHSSSDHERFLLATIEMAILLHREEWRRASWSSGIPGHPD